MTHLQRSLAQADERRWIEGWNHFYLGRAHEQLGDLDRARHYYLRAIELQATPECVSSAQMRLRHLGRDPYAEWLTVESKHFAIRYPPDSPVSADIRVFARKLDHAADEICRFLQVQPRRKITFYVYNDTEHGRQITGAAPGWADRQEQAVHQHVGQTLGHEMTHCLSHLITAGPYCDSVVINEGLAVYLDQTRRDKHAEARAALRNNVLPTFAELEASFAARSDAYPLAGSFTGFLLETFSRELFFNVWRDSSAGRIEEAFRRHYRKDSAELSSMWREFLIQEQRDGQPRRP